MFPDLFLELGATANILPNSPLHFSSLSSSLLVSLSKVTAWCFRRLVFPLGILYHFTIEKIFNFYYFFNFFLFIYFFNSSPLPLPSIIIDGKTSKKLC